MRRLVIIGNSAAGLAAVEAVRSRDRRCRITLIAAEIHPPYSRIMLTYLLAGKVDRNGLSLHGADWYERMDVKPLIGHRALAIDTRRRQVVVAKSSGNGKPVAGRSRRTESVIRARSASDGEASPDCGNRPRRVPYDRLLIATGAVAQRPTLPGIDRLGVFCLRDLDDAVAILDYAEAHGLLVPSVGRALFLGGGPVCLQTLTALADRGMKVTVVVRSRMIFSQLADPHTAALAERVLRAGGARIIKGADPAAIEERSAQRGSRMVVRTREGRRLPADIIIVGKGTQPELALTRGTDIATDVGVLVDETMETSVPGVFAAGDVAQATHCVSGQKVCYGTWTNACEQGRIAGLNMIGRRTEWTGGLNRNVTTIWGNTLGSIGVLRAATDGRDAAGSARVLHHYRDARRNVSRRLFFRDGRCEGAVLFNACDDLGVLGSLISTHRDCTGWEDRLARGEAAFGEALRRQLARGPAR